jgi:hypothetical protein
MHKNILSDSELLFKTEHAAKTEKYATLELLRYLVQVDERRAYATRECSTLYAYVLTVLGYSEKESNERVNAVRLMRNIPDAENKIANGQLSMTTAARVQQFLNVEKKVGNEFSGAEAAVLVEICSGQSKRKLEKTLLGQSSNEAIIIQKECIKEVSVEYTELKFLIPDSTFQKLAEIKNLIGNESLKDIFDLALDSLLEHTKKKKGITARKVTAPGKPELKIDSNQNSETKPTAVKTAYTPSRFIPIDVKRTISIRSGNQCEFIDPKTQKRCSSQYKLELDHYPIPFARGGTNEVSNLRHACRQHNLRHAMDVGLNYFHPENSNSIKKPNPFFQRSGFLIF